jgi:hypothetical protein
MSTQIEEVSNIEPIKVRILSRVEAPGIWEMSGVEKSEKELRAKLFSLLSSCIRAVSVLIFEVGSSAFYPETAVRILEHGSNIA